MEIQRLVQESNFRFAVDETICTLNYLSAWSVDHKRLSMNMTNSSLLPYRRGPVDGHKFFSRSPFRSVYFLVMTLGCIASLVFAVYLMYRNWGKLGFNEFTTVIWISWAGIITTWIRALMAIDRVRQLYFEGSITKVDPGSPMDVALGTAAEAIINNLFFYSGSVLVLLMLLNHALERCS